MNTVTVATFNDPEKAQPLKNRLVQAGIQTEVVDEKNLQHVGFASESLAGIRVRVPKADFEKALLLLKQWEPEGVLRDAVRCPKCKSSRIQYPQMTRKFVLPALLRIGIALGIFKKQFYCEDCQYTWGIEVPADPVERRKMGA